MAWPTSCPALQRAPRFVMLAPPSLLPAAAAGKTLAGGPDFRWAVNNVAHACRMHAPAVSAPQAKLRFSLLADVASARSCLARHSATSSCVTQECKQNPASPCFVRGPIASTLVLTSTRKALVFSASADRNVEVQHRVQAGGRSTRPRFRETPHRSALHERRSRLKRTFRPSMAPAFCQDGGGRKCTGGAFRPVSRSCRLSYGTCAVAAFTRAHQGVSHSI